MSTYIFPWLILRLNGTLNTFSGTLLGSTLVNMFPDRVGRVIVDGVVEPEGWWSDRPDLSWAGSVEATDEAFQGFANACKLSGPDACVLSDTQLNANMDVISWVQNLTEVRIINIIVFCIDAQRSCVSQWAHDAADVGYVVRSTVFKAMYAPKKWSALANEDLASLFLLLYNGTISEMYDGAENTPMDFDAMTAPHSDAQMAIQAGDSADPADGLTMETVFDELLRVSHEVSGYCEWTPIVSTFINSRIWGI